MIPIGFTIINSGSTVSINVNWSESVQRSRPTSAPPTSRTRSKSAAATSAPWPARARRDPEPHFVAVRGKPASETECVSAGFLVGGQLRQGLRAAGPVIESSFDDDLRNDRRSVGHEFVPSLPSESFTIRALSVGIETALTRVRRAPSSRPWMSPLLAGPYASALGRRHPLEPKAHGDP